MATFCIDIDGTICTTTQNQEYEKAIPYRHMINKINKLYDEGHTIKMLTARGMGSGKDFTEITKKQLNNWGVKHHSLQMGKPAADYYVDDKCLTPAQFANMEPK
jgi:uncharacterized HAD superfamily protein